MRTAHAREKIRQWFRKQQREENIVRGRELVEKALKRLGVDDVKLDDLAADFQFDKVDDFLAAVGYGDINPDEIGRHVLAGTEEQRKDEQRRPAVRPAGHADWRPARAGRGRPADARVLARATRCPATTSSATSRAAEGVTVHRADCSSVLNEDEKERLISVDWSESDQHVFPVTVRLEAWDREGLVRDVTAHPGRREGRTSPRSAPSCTRIRRRRSG